MGRMMMLQEEDDVFAAAVVVVVVVVFCCLAHTQTHICANYTTCPHMMLRFQQPFGGARNGGTPNIPVTPNISPLTAKRSFYKLRSKINFHEHAAGNPGQLLIKYIMLRDHSSKQTAEPREING